MSLFKDLTEYQRKELVSEIIDICLYSEEGFTKLLNLVEEHKSETKRTNVNTSNFKENDDTH